MATPIKNLSAWENFLTEYTDDILENIVGLDTTADNLSNGYDVRDVNEDGSISLTDVLIVLRMSVQLRNFTPTDGSTEGQHVYKAMTEKYTRVGYTNAINNQEWEISSGNELNERRKIPPTTQYHPNPTHGSDAMCLGRFAGNELRGSGNGPYSISDLRTSTDNTSGTFSFDEFYGIQGLDQYNLVDSRNFSSNTNWQEYDIDITNAYLQTGGIFRVIVRYINGTSGTSYRGDFQIRRMRLVTTSNAGRWDDNFECGSSGWDYANSNNGYTEPGQIPESSWEKIYSSTASDSRVSGRWNWDADGTGSGSTGIGGAERYIYAETSSSNSLGRSHWARSSPIYLNNNDNLQYIRFEVGHYGNNVGSWEVYLERMDLDSTIASYDRPIARYAFQTSSSNVTSRISLPNRILEGQTFKVVLKYQNGSAGIQGRDSGTNSYQGDFQLVRMDFYDIAGTVRNTWTIGATQTTGDSNNTAHTLQQKHIHFHEEVSTWLSTASFSSVAGRWNKRAGTTPSSGTGSYNAYNVYTETSGTQTGGACYIFRTKDLTASTSTQSNAGLASFDIEFRANGSNVGSLYVFYYIV